MFSVQNKGLESIRLLRKARASLTAKNNDGVTAQEMADETKDKAVLRALDPEKEQWALGKLAALVVSFLLYVVAWVNDAVNGVIRRSPGLDPELDLDLDRRVNAEGTSDTATFEKNVDKFVTENGTLSRFFKGNPNYIQELTKKAADLEKDSSTPLGCKDLLPKTIKVSLHQQVIYCDDSSSMKRDGRWEAQKLLVKRIAKITTRILPEGEGVALRFINQDTDQSPDLTLQRIGELMEGTSWQPGGNTEIGTYLRRKVFEELVYPKLEDKSLERPLLISVITDGMPSQEDKGELVKAIVECGNKLEGAGYPRNSVKFMVGQIGAVESATRFLESIRSNTEIADVVFCTSDQLDERLAEFKENDGDLDRWLIETLFSPLKDR